jgi:signal transduction histidine kinase
MRLGRALQRSREELVTLREEERRRIRRDLHDGLGPALAGIALGLDAVGRIAEQDPPEAGALAEQLKREVHASLSDVRRLVEDLRPPALDQLGLVGALRQQADRLSEREADLHVEVSAEGLPPLPAAVEVAAYRIATEALNNVSRHAAARQCQVRFTMDDEALTVEVEDDGVGLREPRRAGVGLTAMRERATELGGSCSVTASGRGTRVRASLPVAQT